MLFRNDKVEGKYVLLCGEKSTKLMSKSDAHTLAIECGMQMVKLGLHEESKYEKVRFVVKEENSN
jgi:hypothetical protein